MSKGPGKIERAVAALFADPTRTWTAEDLAVEVYGDERGWPDQNKGHRVAVLRAARRVAARLGWRHDNLHGTGTGTMLFYRADNETSFVAMRLRRRQRYIGSAEAAEWLAEERCRGQPSTNSIQPHDWDDWRTEFGIAALDQEGDAAGAARLQQQLDAAQRARQARR